MVLGLATVLFAALGPAVEADYLTKRKQYLFAADGDPKASSPVVEYIGNILTIDEVVIPPFLKQRPHYYRLVQFYESSCTQCVDFKEKFIELSNNVREQALKERGVSVSVYAISCSHYPTLCEEQEVSHFPTVRVLGSGTKVIEVDLETVQPLDVMEHMGLLPQQDQPKNDEDDDDDVKDDEGWLAAAMDRVEQLCLMEWSSLVSFVQHKLKSMTAVHASFPAIHLRAASLSLPFMFVFVLFRMCRTSQKEIDLLEAMEEDSSEEENDMHGSGLHLE